MSEDIDRRAVATSRLLKSERSPVILVLFSGQMLPAMQRPRLFLITCIDNP
jgi:hypothetical protein